MNRDADSKDHTDVVEEILDHDFEGEGGGRSLFGPNLAQRGFCLCFDGWISTHKK